MRDVSCLIECEPSSIFGAPSDGNLFGTDWDTKLISSSKLLKHEFIFYITSHWQLTCCICMSLDFCAEVHTFWKKWHVCSKNFGQRKNGRIIELVPSAGRRLCAGYYVVTVRLEKKMKCLKCQQKNSWNHFSHTQKNCSYFW